ncbi:antibiotic biosynthesis monooxygenase family protein [Mesorhizobium sp.]|uniref:antibiotic biosynthesis monooxygenase family protein n=1 Tax=Mesorhizobium sp. TaxID=1871066 RepID=UPI000FE95FDF|nr:antibiotic biosynthesis monooxygenase family protein [Mesorhizobium sp.]RWC25619.1 MAG: antibiotic biosynthesis monooxygenase [Mesorhizobium sp.]RWC40049.1 MAG: antibiotic biosynthesis monooxygenase [Mesorhizobium sp.]RWC54951.1 MAG: antibiotic biosynthesis monooxygenase [Mesorhizobium sp.]RWC58715.1 MAG: antibiotic biosynthesis monooxygenase [Mesorhizobium sp.]
MPIIRANTGVITQINVFTVPEGGQQALIELLREAAMSCRGIPGWMSASLHRSLDGTRVVNYAQARDQAAMRHVFEHLQANGFLERNKTLGLAHPGLYEVALTVE